MLNSEKHNLISPLFKKTCALRISVVWHTFSFLKSERQECERDTDLYFGDFVSSINVSVSMFACAQSTEYIILHKKLSLVEGS